MGQNNMGQNSMDQRSANPESLESGAPVSSGVPEFADPTSIRRRMLEQLEASLRLSQQALLARDLARIEQLSVEQTVLCHALGSVRASAGCRTVATDSRTLAAAARVLELGRVQAELLCRAQQSLRMLSHVLAGAQADYGPPAGLRQVAAGRALPSRGKG